MCAPPPSRRPWRAEAARSPATARRHRRIAMTELPPSAEAKPAPAARSAWTALVVLTLVNLVNYMDRYVVPGVGESLQHSELHLTDSQFGALTSAFFLVYMFA